MTTNHTSQAIEDLIKWLDNPKPTPLYLTQADSTLIHRAIAEKYLRMESCLELLAAHGVAEWDRENARTALSFDPLSQP